MKYIINGKLNKIENATSENISTIVNEARKGIVELHNLISTDLLDLTQLESSTYWRKVKLAKLSRTIQERLYKLQFPSDCSKVKKLSCDLWDCGTGCKLEMLSYCLAVAYNENRLVLPALNVDIFNGKKINISWNDFFLPITNCTTNNDKYK